MYKFKFWEASPCNNQSEDRWRLHTHFTADQAEDCLYEGWRTTTLERYTIFVLLQVAGYLRFIQIMYYRSTNGLLIPPKHLRNAGKIPP